MPKAIPVKGVKVKTAFLHSALTWPGVAGSETSISDAKIKGVTMTLLPQGLLLELTKINRTTKKDEVQSPCLVPHTNVKNYVLYDMTGLLE